MNNSSTSTYADQNCAYTRTSSLFECTNSSLGPSVLVQGSDSSTSLKHNCVTVNWTDKPVSNYGNIIIIISHGLFI